MARPSASFSSSPLLSVTAVLLSLCWTNLIAIADARAYIAQVISTGPASSPYYALYNLSTGTPPQPQQLLLSIDSTAYPWLKCGPGSSFLPSSSSSFHYLQCGQNRGPCNVHLPPYPLTGRLASDNFFLHTTNGSSQGPLAPVPQLKFACVSNNPDVASPLAGVASLSPSKRSIPAQLATRGISAKFAYCLPSPGSMQGPVFFGEGIGYLFGSPPVMNISAFLAYATLLQTSRGQYALALRGIKVDGNPIQVKGSQTLAIDLILSTVERYTKLERGVYAALTEAFKQAAKARGIATVAGEGGFDTCFNASTIGFSRVGYAVPSIELDVQGTSTEEEAWQVFGFNSMVSVSEEVVCLGFVDAGASKACVLGTFQQQDNLLEFDIAKKRLGFSGVLDFYRTTCSDFSF